MRVRLSPDALADLQEIGDFIAEDDRQRAITFIGELEACCFSLAEFPNAYPDVEALKASAVRRRNHGRYAILYKADEDGVDIFRVVHGARDIADLFAS